MHRALQLLWSYRKYIIIFLTPLLLLPLPLVATGSEAKGGFVVILMAIYWCTECIPLAVTGLLPLILFPILGIMRAEEVSIEYLRDTNVLFIGGLFVAIAVEKWNLQKRIALRILLLLGVRPSLLMIGFMIVTAFMSMWISNSATTAMMLPIANAVLQQLEATEAQSEEPDLETAAKDNPAFEHETRQTKEKVTDEKMPDAESQLEDIGYVEPGSQQESRNKAMRAKYELLHKGISLSVCYSASIGGTATITGTTPNLILKGQIDDLFPSNGDVLNFASWFAFAFPNMVITLVLAWIWLQSIFLGFNYKKTFGCGMKKDKDKEAYMVLKEEYKKLGPMKFAEVAVLTLFILLVLLWFTRAPGFVDGWAKLIFGADASYVSDGTVAIFMSVFFFIIPSELPKFPRSKSENYSVNDEDRKVKAPEPLLSWSAIHERLPWNIVLLLGGGYALAAGSEVSGLSTWLGQNLSPLQNIPKYAISLLLSMLVAVFTECSSNTATVTLFLPILASMATTIEMHPLYVMLPCTIASSLAFMLPVATPPNAIAFSFGHLKVIDMVKSGFILNIIGILTVNLGINTWGYAMFNMGTFPDWANATNSRP